MKPYVLAHIFLAASLTLANAETFLVGEGQTNSIAIAKDEAIVISFVDSNHPYPLYQDGTNSSIAGIRKGYAFAGPSSLLFSDRSAVVTFNRLRGAGFKTLVLGSVTNTLVLPERRSIRIFPVEGTGKMTLSIGSHSRTVDLSFGVQQTPVEFNGPLAIALSGFESFEFGHPYRQVITYCITDDQVVLDPGGVIQASAGAIKLSIERSSELSSWSPAVVQLLFNEDAKAFYRLRVEK